MGRRRRDVQGPEREELLVAAGGAAATSTRAPGNVGDHLLTLQQTHGNRAVTTIVQREGSKAATTNAPSYKEPKKKKKGPAPKAEESFAPTTSRVNGNIDVIRKMAADYWNGTNGEKVDLDKAALYHEEIWYRTDEERPSRAVALNISRIHKERGDAKRAAYWMKVQAGDIKPKSQPAPGSDQHA